MTEEEAEDAARFLTTIRDPSLDGMTDAEKLDYVRSHHAAYLQRVRDKPAGSQTPAPVAAAPARRERPEWQRRALAGLGSLVGIGIFLAVAVGSNIADARGVWDWIGERVGPTCVLAPTASGAQSTITVQGWKASDVCKAFVEDHSDYAVVQTSTSAPSVCEYDRLSVHWVVRDPTGQENGTATCGGVSQLPSS